MAGDLTTLDNVKTYLGILPGDTDSDAILSLLIGERSQWFKTKTRRGLTLQTGIVEYRNGDGSRAMPLREYPVVSVAEVWIDGTVVDPLPTPVAGEVADPGWVVQDDRVCLVDYTGGYEPLAGDYGPYYVGTAGPRLLFNKGFKNVRFTYTAGYATIPDDVSAAVTKMVVMDFGERQRVGVKSRSTDGAAVSYDREPPESVKETIAAYTSWVSL